MCVSQLQVFVATICSMQDVLCGPTVKRIARTFAYGMYYARRTLKKQHIRCEVDRWRPVLCLWASPPTAATHPPLLQVKCPGDLE